MQKALIEAEKIIQSRTQASIPRNLDTLETMVLQHKVCFSSVILMKLRRRQLKIIVYLILLPLLQTFFSPQEFENNLQSLEGQVIEMQVTFKRIIKKSQAIQQRHDTIVKKWEDIWSLSHIYVER